MAKGLLNDMSSQTYDYASFLSKRLRSGKWVPVFLSDLQALTPIEVLVLGVILNMGKINHDEKGWVWVAPSILTNSLGLTKAEQDEVLTGPEERKIVRVRMRGNPPRRYVRINLAKLEALSA